MNISRRDVLKLVGGSAVGFLFTPMPWKALDDSALWTQNWPWMPKPAKGSTTFTYSACALCPAACGIKARCVGGRPVLLEGVGFPRPGGGSVCPMGIAAHHLAVHPARVAGPMKRNTHGGGHVPMPLEAAVGELSAVIAGASSGTVAILDRQPGRCISSTYRRFLKNVPHGVYLTTGSREHDVFAAYGDMGVLGALGFDCENAATILSVGSPLLEGGSAGTLSRRMQNGLKIIYAGTRQSSTALRASRWLPVKPGSETALVLGIAHVILNEHLNDASSLGRADDAAEYLALISRFTPETTSQATGISADAVRATARQLAGQPPAFVIGGGDPGSGPLDRGTEYAIAGLNLLLGSIGRRGGIILRHDLPETEDRDALASVTPMEKIADGSIRLLIMDNAESGSALPWHLIGRKLQPGKGIVVSLSPFLAGMARNADYIIPAPAPYESLTDLAVPFLSPVATFSLSTPLFAQSAAGVEPTDFINRLARASGIGTSAESSPAASIRMRADRIYAQSRGSFVSFADGKAVELQSISSSDQFWQSLSNGGYWQDSEQDRTNPGRTTLLGSSADVRLKLGEALNPPAGGALQDALVLMPFGECETGSAQVSPLLTKLYRESGLRTPAGAALVHPSTASAAGCSHGKPATLSTERGSMRVEVRENTGVMPGTIQMAVGPDMAAFDPAAGDSGEGILAICGRDGDPTWRLTPAKLRGGVVS